MSDKTTIEWTEATFNPWWGCTKVSPGCDHCYAERDAGRFSPTMKLWGEGSTRREFGESHWLKPVEWNRRAEKAGKRTRVFCASMADVFDKDAPDGAREILWELIDRTPWLDWQLLTKRVGNVARMVPWGDVWPAHVWLGISVVNQDESDRDIPKLLGLPARIRWLSCEPLLGPIDLNAWLFSEHGRRQIGAAPGLSWVVAGGESGPKARPMHPNWARRIRDQCVAARVPFLFKQWGEYGFKADLRPEVMGEFDFPPSERPAWMQRVGKKAAGRTLDGRTWDEYPHSKATPGKAGT